MFLVKHPLNYWGGGKGAVKMGKYIHEHVVGLLRSHIPTPMFINEESMNLTSSFTQRYGTTISLLTNHAFSTVCILLHSGMGRRSSCSQTTLSALSIFFYKNLKDNSLYINPLDAGSRLTDFAQSSNAAGSLLTDCTVYERSG